MAASNPDVSIIGLPFTVCTMSPTRRPPLAAGPSRNTPAMITPRASRSIWNARASSGVRSCGSTPSQPRLTPPVLTISSITLRAMSIGVAKPMPIDPPDSE